MKSYCLLSAFILTVTTSFAQDFPGYRAGNFTGVNGVFFNPANIADSRYRFDFNLVSASSFVGNNKASFNLKSITQSFDSDSLKRQFTGSGAGASTGFVNVDVHGPSLMFNAGRGAIALTTRARVMANIIDVDGELVNQLSEDANSNISFPYTIKSGQNMRVAVNGWTEFGLSYARIFKNEGAHFFKGGATLKYLSGVANGFVNIDGLNGTLAKDAAQNVFLTNATGRLATGFGGVNVSELELGDLTQMESTGFGGDIGFVYEWRPNGERYKLRSGDEMQDRNKYKLKLGLALLDIGKIKYSKDVQRSGSYDVAITGNEQLALDELAEEEIDDYNAFFRNKPEFFTPTAGSGENTYKVSLPTTMQLDIDYHLHRGFYVNGATQLSLLGKNTKTYNNRYYNSFTLTPRYEGKAIGLYVPLTYNALTKFSAGASLRFGPLFIGSGSILTAAFGNSKQADVHLGLRFGGLQKNMQKKEDKKARKAERKEARDNKE